MILVLGGTSDSIHICNKLNDMGLPYIVSVTTEYGRDIAKKATENVFLGKLTKEDMVSLIKEKKHNTDNRCNSPLCYCCI